MKKKIKRQYKFGDIIKITARKCSAKVQPGIMVGQMYTVLEQYATKSGAVSLLVVELAALAKGAGKTKSGQIDPKLMHRVNEDRFDWQFLNEKRKRQEYQKTKEILNAKAGKLEKEFLESRFTMDERFMMTYRPYLFAELTWHFALKAIAAVADEKLANTKSLSRKVTDLRRNFIFDLGRHMSSPIINCAQGKVREALEMYKMDFIRLQATINNELNRLYIGVKHDTAITYAIIAIICYDLQKKVDGKNVELIRSRLGWATNHESFGYMTELNSCMEQLVGNHKLQDTLPVTTAIRVLEINIMNLKL